MVWFSEFVGVFVVGFEAIAFFSYLFGSCWLFVFIADDITNDLITFKTHMIPVENAIKTKRNKDEHRVQLMKRFCAIVQIYTDAKE